MMVGFVALEVLVEPEDLDAVLERWVPASSADVGTAHKEAPVDREVLARLRRLQGEEEPVQKGDAPAVGRAAHALKGGSGSMGARRMSGLCAQLEHVGASGDLSQGSERLGRIREELGRVERALEAEVSGNR